MSNQNPTPAPRPRPRLRLALPAAAAWAVLWAVGGCGKKSGQEVVPGTIDTLSVISDTTLVSHDTSAETIDTNIVDTLANDTANYPDEINCLIDSVIPEFSHWEEFKSRPDSPLADLLSFTNSPIRPISLRLFKLSGKSSRRACIWVEIWKMKSSADVRTVDSLNDDSMRWGMDCGGYTPKTFFIFKEYFILVHGCSFMVGSRIFGVQNYIKKRCFNCCTIDGDKVIFGQNDKDW